mgnify:CR=1 FL=1
MLIFVAIVRAPTVLDVTPRGVWRVPRTETWPALAVEVGVEEELRVPQAPSERDRLVVMIARFLRVVVHDAQRRVVLVGDRREKLRIKSPPLCHQRLSWSMSL